ncbi:GTP-binding protein [Tistrella bauzanensis]|uniref:CobW family GTP-binding protein n=1 Tax=Tistrella TaxID=171436 RepID=UPI0031F622C1
MADRIMAERRIPVLVITGFLGAGKTSLIADIFRRRPDLAPATALVVNEFGETGIDHALLRAASERQVAIDAGCICCTMRSDLTDALMRLHLDHARGVIDRLDRVIIETTGLADPAPIIHTLAAHPLVAARFALSGIIACIDAEHGAGQIDRHEEALRQVVLADRIVITKTDLTDIAATTALVARIAALNAGARIMDRRAALDAIDRLISPLPYAPDAHGDTARAWLAAEAAANRMACADGSCAVPGHRHHHHDHEHGHDQGHRHGHGHGHDHDHGHHHAADARIATAMRTLPAGTPQDRIVRAAEHLAAAMGSGLLRLKGLLPAEGERPPLVLHGVQHRLYPPMPLNADASLPDKPTLVAITIDADPAAALDRLAREALS